MALTPNDNPYLRPSPDQELLDSLLSGGGSALRFVGGVLDTPGAIVRNTLALENPLKGLFNLDERTEGRDLLEQYGLLGENTPGFDMGDVAGFAADVVTDPLFYLGVGALRPGGKVLQKAGALPGKTVDAATGALEMGGREARGTQTFADAIAPIAQAADAGDQHAISIFDDLARAAEQQGENPLDLLQNKEALARDIGVSLPFKGEIGSFNVPGSLEVRKFLDRNLHKVRTSAVGRAVAQKFDYGSRGTREAPTQFRAQAATEQIEKDTVANRQAAAAHRLETAAIGLTPEEHNRVLRRVLEQTAPDAKAPLTIEEAVLRNMPDHLQDPDNLGRMAKVATSMADDRERWFQGVRSWGLAANRTDESVYKQLHRQATDPKYLGGRSARAFETKDPFGKRSPHGRVVPGGTETISDIMEDRTLRAVMDANGIQPKPGIAAPATEKQLARLEKTGLPLDDLAKPQASRMIQMLKRAEQEGIPPDEFVTRTQAPGAVYQSIVPAEARQYVLEKYFKWGTDDFERFTELNSMRAKDALNAAELAEYKALKARYDSAGWYAYSNAERPIENFDRRFYGDDPIVDWLKYGEASTTRMRYAEQLYDLFAATSIKDMRAYPRGKGPAGYKSLEDALTAMGVPVDPVARAFAVKRLAPMLHKHGQIDDNVLKNMTDRAAIWDSRGENAIQRANPSEEWNEYNEYDGLLALSQIFVPEKIVYDANRLMTTAEKPGMFEKLFKSLDPILNTTKAHYTVPFPGFHVRNRYNQVWQMLVDGAYDPQYGWADPRAYTQQLHDADLLVRGEKVPNASRYFPGQGLSDEQAQAKLQSWAAGHQLASGRATFHHEGVDVVGRGYQSYVPDLLEHIPGAQKQPSAGYFGLKHLLEGWKDLWRNPAARDPRKVRGGFGVEDSDTLFGPYSGGLRTASYSESTGRIAHGMGHMLQGRSPDVSAMMANAAQVRYDRLTEFEREVMKRVVPFYTWIRGMLPWTLNNLIHKPGGPTAQAIKLFERGKERGGFTPDYLQGTLSVPFGNPDEEGKQTFLTGLDLPFESMNDVVQFGQTPFETAQKTLRSLGGMLRPELQAPIEVATGSSLFQGRNLRELDPVLGRLAANIVGAEEPLIDTPLLDQLVMKSPAARYLSTAKVITDNRDPVHEQLYKKPLHIGTGARFKDVNVPQQMDFKILQELKEEVKGERPFRVGDYITVKREDLPKLSDRQRRLLELYKKRSKEIQKKAREKKG